MSQQPARIIHLLPADGWRIERTDADEGIGWSQPLVGWGLTDSGVVVALDTDADGRVEALDPAHNQELGPVTASWRLVHPGSTLHAGRPQEEHDW